MNEVKSCGLIVFRRQPALQFLLMRHASRWDLPKGHVDPGETDVECALRELLEETGISADRIELDPDYRYVAQYPVFDRRVPGHRALKTLVLFLGWLRGESAIRPTEHIGYEWWSWKPPHRIQEQTIDPLLADLAASGKVVEVVQQK
ncbi:MAG: bis(5'-nucleosyl)-tetraphosphatase [Pirellulaceae bacterium]